LVLDLCVTLLFAFDERAQLALDAVDARSDLPLVLPPVCVIIRVLLGVTPPATGS
jgi:hypothetical protein